MIEQQQQEQVQRFQQLQEELKKVIDLSKLKEERQQQQTKLPPFETQKVTVRREFRRNRFGHTCGPYIYCYWKDKQTHKLKKYYVGKSAEDHDLKANYEFLSGFELGFRSNRPRPSECRKWTFLMEQSVEKQNKFSRTLFEEISK